MVINLRKEETKNLEEITRKIKEAFKDDNYDIKINPYTYEYNNKAVLDYHKKYYQENRERLIAYKREKDFIRKQERQKNKMLKISKEESESEEEFE